MRDEGAQEKHRAAVAGSAGQKSFPLSWEAQHLDTAEEGVKCSSPGQCLLGKIPSQPEV